MATIVHFDIGADNLDRAKKFYEDLFEWKIGAMPGISNYYEITTSDLNGVPGIGGGLTKRENPQQTGITNFIGVVSISETIEKLNKLGGKLIQSKQAIPGYGYVAVCMDTENNVFGLFEDDKKAH